VDGTALTVETAAEIFAPFVGFANAPESVRSLAELWVDYTALALGLGEDPFLAELDLSPVREQQVRQRRILALRDRVIQVDTSFTEEELRARFTQDDPTLEVRARHILLRTSPEATAAERDTVRAVIETLRSRILGGESFEQLAIAYSVDATAADGGDLGFFTRGQMVPAFEEAAFSLEPGEVSEVVETEFGFHIIRVEDQRRTDFESVRDGYREALKNQVRAEVEGAYIAELEDSAGVVIADSAAAVAQAVAENPWRPVEDRGVLLAEWEGGEFTAGELSDYLLAQAREVLEEFRATAGGGWDAVIRNFARQELLLAEADRLEIGFDEAEWDLSDPVIREQATTNAQTMGLSSIEPRPGEDGGEAAQAAVRGALTANLSGDLGLLPMGPAIGPLRAGREIRVNPETFSSVVARVEEIRAAEGFEPYQREGASPSDTATRAEPPAVPAPDSTPSP
jgi:peptidyl-prolyl cis-trans isomerase C